MAEGARVRRRTFRLPALLIYDDACPLCTGIVARLPSTRGRLRYQPRSRIAGPGLRRLADRTVVLWRHGRPAIRSTAVIEALLLLAPVAAPLVAVLLIPRPARDAAYRFIARHRYRLVPRACPAR